MVEGYVCLACGAADCVELYHAKDHLVSGKEFTVRKCNACGMGWTVDPPSESNAGAYYLSEEYISHTDRKQSVSDHLYHLARSFMLGRKKRLVSRVTGKNSGVLVDIGSGTGYFPAYMKKSGWQATGIEISEAARKYSSERFGLKAISPDDVKKLPTASADCITLWHVLEHLYRPDEWLGEISRVLKGDGRCIVALPNFSSTDAGWFGNRWAALDVPRHLWHFSPESLRIFAERNGFECERIFPLPLDLFYISILSFRNQRSSLALIKGLLTGCLLAVRSGFRKEKSSSLVYVLAKRTSGN
ncbi:MAG: class I SAM-dependent methyltransferase [Bacteroidota bacterium]|jgi:SAM-dependent methyltransferase|nr:class I SAM-dependent methyltransferase [Bacteroidota bacterium]